MRGSGGGAGPDGRAGVRRRTAAAMVVLAAAAALTLTPAATAISGASAAPGWGAGTAVWGWPVQPGGPEHVVRRFDPPANRYGPGHRGVDLDALVGQPVLAVGTGQVAFAGTIAGRGVVSVDHAGGLRTTYQPVRATVTAGDPVARGQLLGTLTGEPGHCLPGTCLHWGLRRGSTYLDPLALLGAEPVRLLPLRAREPLFPVSPWVGPTGTESPPWQDRGPLLARG